MMAASLHTLLSKLGLVLGISGFFHSTVSSALGSSKGKQATSRPVSSSPPSIFQVVAPYFTTGILLGGMILGLTRPRIEAGLGVPILDHLIAAGNRSVISTAVFGALVGLGTKVSHGRFSRMRAHHRPG